MCINRVHVRHKKGRPLPPGLEANVYNIFTTYLSTEGLTTNRSNLPTRRVNYRRVR